jgi:hypothetical protein
MAYQQAAKKMKMEAQNWTDLNESVRPVMTSNHKAIHYCAVHICERAYDQAEKYLKSARDMKLEAQNWTELNEAFKHEAKALEALATAKGYARTCH